MAFPSEENQYCTIYVDLRRAISEHIVNGNTSQLGLCEMPTGGRAWQPIEPFVRGDEMDGIVQELNIAEEEVVEDVNLSIDFEGLS